MADDAVLQPPTDEHEDDRRRARREALLAGVSALLVLFVSLFGLWSSAKRAHQEQGRSNLVKLASAMATMVDPELHERVRAAGETDTPDYVQAIAGLRRARVNTPGLRYVYTLERRADTVRFILDTAEPGDRDHDGVEDRSDVGDIYASPDAEMLEALGDTTHEGRATAMTSPSEDAWGTFISGYAPIRNFAGKQIGIVGIDIDAKDFLAEQAASTRATLLGLIPGVLLVAGFTWGIYRLRRHQQRSIRKLLEERKKAAEAELAASHQARRTRAIIEGSGVLAWELDLTADRFTSISAKDTAMGYTSDEWLRPGFWRTIVHEDDVERVQAFLRDAAGSGEHERCEYRIRGATGRLLTIEMVVSPDSNGHATSVVSGVLIDVTEARALRDAFEAASRAKSEFLANMSHEIRTPLTAILGYAELLREDGDMLSAPAHRLQTIDTIRTAGQYLLSVISDILDLSKIEAGRMTVETVAVELPALLRDCEALLAPRAAAKGLAFAVRVDTPVPRRAVTDPTRLRQIILNLAGNAIKFTSAGHVTIRASVPNPCEPVQTLRVDVEDSGPGLAPEQASRLFQAFSQGDNSVTRTHGGTGLGLTISRRLASLMGGDVSLHRTTVGAGSTFRIEVEIIPHEDGATVASLQDDTAAPRPTAAAASGPRLAGRVLVAEDNPVNQRLLEVFLAKGGATVEVAHDGAQALARIDAANQAGAPYDLLLTDMQMPVMDGLTLVRTLRARGDTMPIVALTANAMAEDRQACFDAGCDEYVAKPIDLQNLLDICARWVGASAVGAVGAVAPALAVSPPAVSSTAPGLLQSA